MVAKPNSLPPENYRPAWSVGPIPLLPRKHDGTGRTISDTFESHDHHKHTTSDQTVNASNTDSASVGNDDNPAEFKRGGLTSPVADPPMSD
jgi:hypothetical protein